MVSPELLLPAIYSVIVPAFCIDFKSNHLTVMNMAGSYQDGFYGPEGIGNVIEKSDYICVTAPLTPETKGMVGAAELAKAKPSAGKEIQRELLLWVFLFMNQITHSIIS